jgi:hypothetical protein
MAYPLRILNRDVPEEAAILTAVTEGDAITLVISRRSCVAELVEGRR